MGFLKMRSEGLLVLALSGVLGLAPATAQNPPPAGQTAAPGGQAGAAPQKTPAQIKAETEVAERRFKARLKQLEADKESMSKAERDGIGARLDALCHFRGAWSQPLAGIGLVMGLDGTGDSQSFTATQAAAINFLQAKGLKVDPTTFQSKNMALVAVTCTIPAFAGPGQAMDATVSAMGDAKSLRNGTLMISNLTANSGQTVYAIASGPISVGGFSAQAKGGSASRGFVTVGKIPGGAQLLEGVKTNIVIDGKLYLDLDEAEATTALRIEEKINQTYPELKARALSSGTVELTLPEGLSVSSVQAHVMNLTVQANMEPRVVLEERSGTIIIGGNVKLAPCAIAQGNISVQVTDEFNYEAGPTASGGVGASGSSGNVKATEEKAQITVLRPNTTVADLAQIFQSLKLSASDIMAILENLRAQGALKAKLVMQ